MTKNAEHSDEEYGPWWEHLPDWASGETGSAQVELPPGGVTPAVTVRLAHGDKGPKDVLVSIATPGGEFVPFPREVLFLVTSVFCHNEDVAAGLPGHPLGRAG